MSQPMPGSVAGVSWRPLDAGDVPAVHGLMRAVEVADDQPFVTTLEEMEQHFADPTISLADDTLAGIAPDGTLACFGATRVRQSALRRRSAWLDGHVHPEWRRRGLGSAVLEWTAARARERLAQELSDVPAFLEAWIDERLADRRALLERHGFRPIRWYIEMRRPLDAPLPERALPAELELISWSAERDEAFRAAHNAAFLDHWGSEPLAEGEWRHRNSGSPLFRPSWTYGLWDGERVVAYVMTYHSESDVQATGRHDGWLGQVGTLREWRGKGVASALMTHVMRAMLADGMTHAMLDVDADNPTGALGIYERLGFEPVHRNIRWEKPA